MKLSLGNLERRLFAYAQLRGLGKLSSGDLVSALGLTKRQEVKLFARLSKAGLIAKVRRGLYLVPKRLPMGSIWTPDEATAINTLMEDKKGRYQICGPNAFNRYGYSDQIPVRVYVYNNRLYGDRQIGSVNLILIKVADIRLGLTEEVRTPPGEILVYSSRVRTLIDAVYDWSRFNTLPRAYEWIRDDLRKGKIRVNDLISAVKKFGDVGTLRRIGYLLELEKVSNKYLKQIEKLLRPTSAYIPWIPKRPRKGKVIRRWGVVDNG